MFDKDNLEALELLIDTYNDTDQDTLVLIGKYYLKLDKVIRTRIDKISEKEISLTISLEDKEIHKKIKFPKTVDGASAVSTFLYSYLSEARINAPKDYPKTRLEKLIENTLNLETYITNVKTKKIISSNIIEITFEGGLENLPDLKNDAFMYFMVHKEIDHKFPKNFTIQNFRSLSSQENNPYSAAYYTIKSYRENEIDVWFVLHDHPGPLAIWADQVKEGSSVAIWGPRTVFSPPKETNNYLFIADETAQPAVLSAIENLHKNHSYTCLFETQNKSSRFKINDPNNQISWIYRDQELAGEGTELIKCIERLNLNSKNLYVFGAGEAKQISSIRKILKRQFNLGTKQMSFTGYWRKLAN